MGPAGQISMGHDSLLQRLHGHAGPELRSARRTGRQALKAKRLELLSRHRRQSAAAVKAAEKAQQAPTESGDHFTNPTAVLCIGTKPGRASTRDSQAATFL